MTLEERKSENLWPYLSIFFSQEDVIVPETNYYETIYKTDGLLIWFSLENCYFILTKDKTFWKYVSICNVFPTQSLVLYSVHSDFVDRILVCKRYLRCAWCHVGRTSAQTVDHYGTVNYRTQKLHLPRVPGFLDFSSCFSIQTHAVLNTLIF